MSTETPVPSFLGAAPNGDPSAPVPTKEESRWLAQQILDQAVKALTEEKKKIETAQKAKAEAQVVIDSAKPNIMLAEAAVMVAKANLLKFGAVPKEKTDENPSILEAVKKVLAGAEKQLTVLEICEALREEGVETDSDNLKAYLSRWSKTGVIVAAEKANKFEPARYYAPPVPNGVPGFLSGKAPTPPAQESAEFPEDFPGREPLEEAGFKSPADLAGKTLEELVTIDGIGEKTAKKILAAV